jgi:hypothetical protein
MESVVEMTTETVTVLPGAPGTFVIDNVVPPVANDSGTTRAAQTEMKPCWKEGFMGMGDRGDRL